MSDIVITGSSLSDDGVELVLDQDIAAAKASVLANKLAAETAQTAAETAQGLAENARDTAVAKEALMSPHYSAVDAVLANLTAVQNAATNATNAAASATAAQASLDAMEGTYLGAQASDPSVDLNGDAVTAGDWYFNTTNTVGRVYTGSVWNTIAADSTNFLENADLGVTVQAYNAATALTTDITYEQLNTNGDVGTGAGQLAIGDHNHAGVYEPADATIVKDADIGVTVQGYSSVLANTTASYTTAEETKLASYPATYTTVTEW